MPTKKNREDFLSDSNAGNQSPTTRDQIPPTNFAGTKDNMPTLSEPKIPSGIFQKTDGVVGTLKKMLKSDKQKKAEAMKKQSFMPVKDM